MIVPSPLPPTPPSGSSGLLDATQVFAAAAATPGPGGISTRSVRWSLSLADSQSLRGSRFEFDSRIAFRAERGFLLLNYPPSRASLSRPPLLATPARTRLPAGSPPPPFGLFPTPGLSSRSPFQLQPLGSFRESKNVSLASSASASPSPSPSSSPASESSLAEEPSSSALPLVDPGELEEKELTSTSPLEYSAVVERILQMITTSESNRARDRAHDRALVEADRALDQADRARDRALDQADRALDQADRSRDRALDQADRARDRALDQADRARDRALDQALSRYNFALLRLNGAAANVRLDGLAIDLAGLSRTVGADVVADIVPAVTSHVRLTALSIHGPSAVVLPLPGQKFRGQGGKPVVEFDCSPFLVLRRGLPVQVTPAAGSCSPMEGSEAFDSGSSPPSPGSSAVDMVEFVVCEVKNEVRGKVPREFLFRIGIFKTHLLDCLFPYLLREAPAFEGTPSPPPAHPAIAASSKKFAEYALAIGDLLYEAGLRRADLERLLEGGGLNLRITGYLGGRLFLQDRRTEALRYGLRVVWTLPGACNVTMWKGKAEMSWCSTEEEGEVIKRPGPAESDLDRRTVNNVRDWVEEGKRLARYMSEFTAAAAHAKAENNEKPKGSSALAVAEAEAEVAVSHAAPEKLGHSPASASANSQ